jgi:hypothetical protein
MSKIKRISVEENDIGGQSIHVEFESGWNELIMLPARALKDRHALAEGIRHLATNIDRNEGVETGKAG